MIEPARRPIVFLATLLAVLVSAAASLVPAGQAKAQGLYQQAKYAAIVVDANSGEVLYARRADALRYPASITKVMTLYLVFEAMATGRLSASDAVVFSRAAQSAAPTKIGLRAGDSLTVDQAIRAVTTKSANDVAVALAEKIGGTESRFAALMTLRAQELGMTNTRFVNSSGLPDNRQITTARDIAILSRAVMRDYPQYYHYFGVKYFEFRGQNIRNHNTLLRTMPGVDGLKTGYTNASGYNLAASAVRDGRRLISVVLGGSSTAARDDNVEELLKAGFDVIAKRKVGQNITLAANMSEPDDLAAAALRPSVEQGSTDQTGLQIMLADANLRGVQTASYASRAGGPEWQTSPAVLRGDEIGLTETCRKVTRTKTVRVRISKKSKKTRAKKVNYTATVCSRPPDIAVPLRAVAEAPAPVKAAATTERRCSKVGKGKQRRTVCKTVQVAAKAAPMTTIAAGAKPVEVKTATVAKPSPAALTKVATVAAPAAAATVATVAKPAKAETPKAESGATANGRYLIQVGAFRSRGDAQDHLTKITRKYGGVVSGGGMVQDAGNGNFRARFSGFSADEAKAACKALTDKGERCMVLSGRTS